MVICRYVELERIVDDLAPDDNARAMSDGDAPPMYCRGSIEEHPFPFDRESGVAVANSMAC